jgi:solute carrier family 25 carnitine/acylcarnitine transporter 20/29
MNETLMEVEHTPPVHKRILDIMPGVSGGVARIMVGQPFDTIKTRLQVLGKGTIGAAGMPPEMVYTSGMDCVRKMVSWRLGLEMCAATCVSKFVNALH